MQTIESFQKEYGRDNGNRILYKSIFYNAVVLWRPLLKCEADYLKDNNNLTIIEIEDYVWEKCVVFYFVYNYDLTAGVVSTVAHQILYFTGFNSPTEEVVLGTLAKYRNAKTTDPLMAAYALICHAFSYKLEDLDNKSFEDIMKLVVLAEEVTGLKYEYGSNTSSQDNTTKQVVQEWAPNPRAKESRKIAGVDTGPYDQAMRDLKSRFDVGPGSLNYEIFQQIPLLTKKDIYQDKIYVNTKEENKKMVRDFIDLIPEDFKRKELGIYW